MLLHRVVRSVHKVLSYWPRFLGEEGLNVDHRSGSNSCKAYLIQSQARDLRAALVVRDDRGIVKNESVDNVSTLSVVLVER